MTKVRPDQIFNAGMCRTKAIKNIEFKLTYIKIVGLDSAVCTEEDMEVSSNQNKNKRKQFKPVTPKRDKKRRILYVIAQSIIDRLTSKY